MWLDERYRIAGPEIPVESEPPRRRRLARGRMSDLFGDPSASFQRLILQIPGPLIAVTVHELAHALVADRLGDPTARLQGGSR